MTFNIVHAICDAASMRRRAEGLQWSPDEDVFDDSVHPENRNRRSTIGKARLRLRWKDSGAKGTPSLSMVDVISPCNSLRGRWQPMYTACHASGDRKRRPYGTRDGVGIYCFRPYDDSPSRPRERELRPLRRLLERGKLASVQVARLVIARRRSCCDCFVGYILPDRLHGLQTLTGDNPHYAQNPSMSGTA